MRQTPDEPVLHSTSRRRIRDSIHPRVFGWSAAVILLFVVFAATFTDTAGVLFGDLRSRITDTFGWFFILAVILFLGFCAWLALGPYARVRLGPRSAGSGEAIRHAVASLSPSALVRALADRALATMALPDQPDDDVSTDEHADDSTPDYSNLSWFATLFTVGP